MAPRLGSPNPLYSAGGIIALLGVQFGPLVFLIVRAGLRKLPRELVEAALSSGAGKITVLRTVILPLMVPAIIGATALTFVSCVGNFGIPAFLGIPANFLVLPTLIYQRLSGGGPAVLTDVSILSTLIGFIAIMGIVTQEYVSRRRDYRIASTSLPAEPFELGRTRIWIELFLLFIVVAVLVLPLFGLLLTSLVGSYGMPLTRASATLANYHFVLFEHAGTRRAFVNSFILALSAAFFAVLIAVPLAYITTWRKRWWTGLFNLTAELPYALPGVVMAIASLLLFLKPVPVIGIHIYNTLWIILYAYLARFFVLALRPTVTGLHQIDRALEEAAQVAGASLFMRLRTIIFPIVAPATLAGGEFATRNFREALLLAGAGRANAVCFTPFNKKAMRFAYPGYDDEIRFVADVLGFTGKVREFNVLEKVWNARVTSHIPLSAVASSISVDGILEELDLAQKCLKSAGYDAPKIAVAGINPHAGDGGSFGMEEIDIIEPAVEAAKARGYDVEGPFPADTVFLRAIKDGFQAVLTMYHDQGQIAMKLMGFDKGVTMMGGLPFPLCTPAHGTAYDIAGKGIADVGATREALLLAARMAARLAAAAA